MIPFSLILQLVSMQGTTQQPAHLSRAEIHARFRAEALDPQRLLAESRRAKGCREDVEPSTMGQSTANSYTPGQPTKRGSAVHFDLPDDWMYPELKSFPTKRFTPPGDNDSLPNGEGMPVFIQPKARAALAPFSLVESPGGVPLALTQLKGKVLILYFFNPTCPHTQVLPEIIRLQSMQSHFSFQVLPILIGSEKLEAIEAFRRLNPKTIPADFRIFHLFGMPAGSLKVSLDLTVSPTTYILDREGRVAWRIPGEIPGALSAKVNHILSEPETQEAVSQ